MGPEARLNFFQEFLRERGKIKTVVGAGIGSDDRVPARAGDDGQTVSLQGWKGE